MPIYARSLNRYAHYEQRPVEEEQSAQRHEMFLGLPSLRPIPGGRRRPGRRQHGKRVAMYSRKMYGRWTTVYSLQSTVPSALGA